MSVKDWLETLEEPYRTKALGYMLPNLDHEVYSDISNVVSALRVAFFWGDSPEGYDYWNDLASNLE